MIIYIHGFASSGFGTKAQEFKKYYKDEIICLSLPTIPLLAINNLEQIIESYLKLGEKVSLIGSSLGGFYSLYLANKYNLKAVLINPALNPKDTLKRFYTFGFVKNYYDESRFEITKEQLDSLINFEVKEMKNRENILALIQKGDEIIDFKESIKVLENCEIILEDGGNHSFKDIERYFSKIDYFFNN